MTMNVELLKSQKEWHALRKQWDTLLETSVFPSVFISFDYVVKAFELFHADSAEPFILVIRDPEGLVVGIAPFRRSMHRRWSVNQAVLEYLVTWEVDKPYILARDGWEDSVWEAIFVYLDENPDKWDQLELAEMPNHLSGAARVQQLFHAPAYQCRTQAGPTGPYIDLTQPWEQFLKEHKKYRRAYAQLKRLRPNYEVVTYNNSATIVEGMAHYAAVETLSWKNGKTGLQRTAQHFEFYQHIATVLAAKSKASIHVLMSSERRPIAAILCWMSADTLFVHHTTFDPELADYSPGKVLMGLVLKEYRGHQTLKTADLMCGFAQYYTPWADRLVNTTNVTINRLSPGMRLLLTGQWFKGLFG